MENEKYIIRFEGISVMEANKYAAELREIILDSHPDVEVEHRRDDPRTQDFGATLVLVLGTGAAIQVANGIKNWLTKRSSSTISIEKNEKGEIKVVATNVSNRTVDKLAEWLQS